MRQSFGEELLTGWFLAFLVGASLAVSVPAGLRARRNSPFSSAQLFKKRMSMMAPRSRGGRWVIVPEGHSGVQARQIERRTRRRRSRIMTMLVVAAFTTGCWAAFGSGVAISIHVAVDVIALLYAVLVYRVGRRRSERFREVRTITRHPLAGTTVTWPTAIHNITLDDEPLFVDEPIAL
ncbi:MAG: hypothetical protein KY391_05420 [Actinobacteria bacterium]|nr:hypothetical protein [Actinomycetota bacterium]